MTEHIISISDALYKKAQSIARQTDRPVDELIRTRLEHALDDGAFDLPADERDELKALEYLSDDALFNIMREQMQPAKQQRMTNLLNRNSDGSITPGELAELEALVEDGQRLTLRKATAFALLRERGHQA
jgi:hypothetical protein